MTSRGPMNHRVASNDGTIGEAQERIDPALGTPDDAQTVADRDQTFRIMTRLPLTAIRPRPTPTRLPTLAISRRWRAIRLRRSETASWRRETLPGRTAGVR